MSDCEEVHNRTIKLFYTEMENHTPNVVDNQMESQITNTNNLTKKTNIPSHGSISDIQDQNFPFLREIVIVLIL